MIDARPGKIAVVFLLAAAASGGIVARIPVRTDLLDVLPEGNPTIRAFRGFLDDFGMMDGLVLVVSSREAIAGGPDRGGGDHRGGTLRILPGRIGRLQSLPLGWGPRREAFPCVPRCAGDRAALGPPYPGRDPPADPEEPGGAPQPAGFTPGGGSDFTGSAELEGDPPGEPAPRRGSGGDRSFHGVLHGRRPDVRPRDGAAEGIRPGRLLRGEPVPGSGGNRVQGIRCAGREGCGPGEARRRVCECGGGVRRDLARHGRLLHLLLRPRAAPRLPGVSSSAGRAGRFRPDAVRRPLLDAPVRLPAVRGPEHRHEHRRRDADRPVRRLHDPRVPSVRRGAARREGRRCRRWRPPSPIRGRRSSAARRRARSPSFP